MKTLIATLLIAAPLVAASSFAQAQDTAPKATAAKKTVHKAAKKPVAKKGAKAAAGAAAAATAVAAVPDVPLSTEDLAVSERVDLRRTRHGRGGNSLRPVAGQSQGCVNAKGAAGRFSRPRPVQFTPLFTV